ncbi:hypothetical protein LSH36_497g01016 [Paralvinella palmiformis]|uniref:Alkaline phosphatase n=1 Tax=Paralvinella palmiformis TaxID=53620 RepID=A0AAD9JA20_9ANNE|nr:hypothetical protein LSH36_497g01016 [Paralvinella palmiformis]
MLVMFGQSQSAINHANKSSIKLSQLAFAGQVILMAGDPDTMAFGCVGQVSALDSGKVNLSLHIHKEWFELGESYIKEALTKKRIDNIAKNVILFIGDGMGASTVTAARIYKGQKSGNPGEETVLNFEDFPNVALSKHLLIDTLHKESVNVSLQIQFLANGAVLWYQRAKYHKMHAIIFKVWQNLTDGEVSAKHLLKLCSRLSGPTISVKSEPDTYNVDRQVADSAGTATAMMSGFKTKFGLIGVNQNVITKDCKSATGNEVDTMLDWSEEDGKWSGLVTTTRLTHATPAAAYGHTPWRFWEVDHAVPEECREIVDDLAKQLLVDNRNIRVILGGGRAVFMSKDHDKDPEYPDIPGQRHDGRNLIKEWIDYHHELGHSYHYVWNETSFAKIDPEKTDFLLGIFEPNHMKYELERHSDKAGEPSIAEMTEKALSILDKNKKGYFLMVEGGRIDHGHHDGSAKKALEDTLAFEEAIQRALAMTIEEDTLIIITADHSHTLTLGTYPARGSNILGFVDNLALEYADVKDEYPVTALMYANGPGSNKREDLDGDVDPTADDFLQPSLVPMRYETHGGEDVAIYARGPMAHLIHGVKEQNYIGHVMAYAACELYGIDVVSDNDDDNDDNDDNNDDNDDEYNLRT